MPEALPDQKVAEFRQKICEVAMRQFRERSAECVSMRSLARELGYSATALYSYYKNKDEILAAVRVIYIQNLTAGLHKALDSASPEDRVEAFIDSYMRFAHADQAAYKLTFSLEQPAPAHYPALAQAFLDLERAFRRLIQATSERRSQAQIEQTAQLTLAAFHGAAALSVAGIGSTSRISARTLRNLLLASLLKAMDANGELERAGRRAEQMAFDL